MFDLTGKVSLVTGAASGIGLAIARALSAHGATVYLADRDEPAGRRAASELRSLNRPAHFLSVDVSDEAACRRAAERQNAKPEVRPHLTV